MHVQLDQSVNHASLKLILCRVTLERHTLYDANNKRNDNRIAYGLSSYFHKKRKQFLYSKDYK